MKEKILAKDEVLQLQLLVADRRLRGDLIKQIVRNRGQKPEALTFADVFTASPDVFFNYVVKFGWNSERVQEVKIRPPDSFATAEFYIHPMADQWCISSLADRGQWIEKLFPTLLLARAEMMNILIATEWGGWNSANRDFFLKKQGYPLDTLYPPPPTVISK
jgi:hypothetical protein